MKKVILVMMLLSSNVFANVSECKYTQGTLKMESSQVPGLAEADFRYSIELASPYFPQADLFRIDYKACIDNECNNAHLIMINKPEGYTEHNHWVVRSNKNLSPGKHKFFYEISIPRYDCAAFSTTEIIK